MADKKSSKKNKNKHSKYKETKVEEVVAEVKAEAAGAVRRIVELEAEEDGVGV